MTYKRCDAVSILFIMSCHIDFYTVLARNEEFFAFINKIYELEMEFLRRIFFCKKLQLVDDFFKVCCVLFCIPCADENNLTYRFAEMK